MQFTKPNFNSDMTTGTGANMSHEKNAPAPTQPQNFPVASPSGRALPAAANGTHNLSTAPTYQARNQQERRATAKLDYYKKLAELQQMNLEFGRNIREAQHQAKQSQEPNAKVAARAQNGVPLTNTNNKSVNGPSTHPLSTAFHVATKSNGTSASNGNGHGAATAAALELPALTKPLPQGERVTASLDFNRLIELQRRYDEVQNQQRIAQMDAPLAHRTSEAAEVVQLSIEDRLAARLLENSAPRLPLREWSDVEERKLTPVQPQGALTSIALPTTARDATPSRPLSNLERRVTANPSAHYSYQTSQAMQRPTTEALHRRSAQQLEPTPERIREALLDPTRIDPHLISLSDLNPRAAKYYDQVAVSLISISYKRLLKRVLVASALHGEGRTSVTLNLAGALARARQRVLVIDCDLLNPSVLRLLGLDAPIGLSEAVHRGLGPNAAALRVQPAAFNLLPMREKVSHSAELLASPRFHELIQLCEADYDFLLFDSSPLLESPDANLLAGLTDATLMVIRPGYSTTQQMAKAVSLFSEKDICGVVLNRIAN